MLSAEPAQLAEFGIEASDVALLRLVRDIACRLLLGAVQSRPTLGNWQALLDYCQVAMSYEQVEQLPHPLPRPEEPPDRRRGATAGTVNHTPVYPREVVKRALLLNASAVILVHNHPSGDPTPSRDDIEMTRMLHEALAPARDRAARPPSDRTWSARVVSVAWSALAAAASSTCCFPASVPPARLAAALQCLGVFWPVVTTPLRNAR